LANTNRTFVFRRIKAIDSSTTASLLLQFPLPLRGGDGQGEEVCSPFWWIRPNFTSHQFQKSALARPVGTEHGPVFPFPQLPGNAPKHGPPIQRDVDIFEPNQNLWRHCGD